MATVPKALAHHIAAQLGETYEKPHKQIEHIIDQLGEEVAQSLVYEALAVRAEGGQQIAKGSRHRTLGGIFFNIAKQRIVAKLVTEGIPIRPAQERFEKFRWAQRLDILRELLKHIGDLASMKITMIGRPGRIEKRENLIITTMRYALSDKVTLPKGVPRPPKQPSVYTIYIALKQWNKIAEALADPSDSLIVEGIAMYDAELPGIAVFAQNATTKKLQRAQKAAGQPPDTTEKP